MPFPFKDRFKNGRFVPNTDVKAMPVGYTRPMSDAEMFARFIQGPQMAQLARSNELDTFEEADDFNIPDDPHPMPEIPFADDFDLAYGKAVHHGVAQKPPEERLEAAQDTIKKARKGLFKPKPDVQAPTLPDDEGSPTGDPQ